MEARFIIPYRLRAIQSIIAGKVCQGRLGSSMATGGAAAGCIALAVKKQKETYVGVQLASSSLFPFYLVQSPGTWNSATYIQDGSNLSRQPLKGIPKRYVSGNSESI